MRCLREFLLVFMANVSDDWDEEWLLVWAWIHIVQETFNSGTLCEEPGHCGSHKVN